LAKCRLFFQKYSVFSKNILTFSLQYTIL
jgi:hypothetical protein